MTKRLERITKVQDSYPLSDEIPAFDMGAFNPAYIIKYYLIEKSRKLSSYFKKR